MQLQYTSTQDCVPAVPATQIALRRVRHSLGCMTLQGCACVVGRIIFTACSALHRALNSTPSRRHPIPYGLDEHLADAAKGSRTTPSIMSWNHRLPCAQVRCEVSATFTPIVIRRSQRHARRDHRAAEKRGNTLGTTVQRETLGDGRSIAAARRPTGIGTLRSNSVVVRAIAIMDSSQSRSHSSSLGANGLSRVSEPFRHRR